MEGHGDMEVQGLVVDHIAKEESDHHGKIASDERKNGKIGTIHPLPL